MATTKEDVKQFLGQTSLPEELADELLASAPELWLSSGPPAILASDLALCHPALVGGEVRAGMSSHDGLWRLCVVSEDRPGLLADTATAVRHQGLSVTSASVISWLHLGLAVHGMSLAASDLSLDALHELTERIRLMGMDPPHRVGFEARGQAVVRRTGEASGDWIISITAPDQPGLLAAACRWFTDNRCDIRSASIATSDGVASDSFIISGSPDPERLAEHLSQPS